MTSREEMAAAAAEVLEPNLQFYRGSPSDTNRYMVGPEVLHALGWAATGIGLPILLSAANEVVKARVKDWLDRSKADPTAAREPPAELAQDVDSMLAARITLGVSPEEERVATEAIADYLSHRGWPLPLAKSDAVEIVSTLKTSLRGRA